MKIKNDSKWGGATKENLGQDFFFFFGRFCTETIRKAQKKEKNHNSLGFYSFGSNLKETAVMSKRVNFFWIFFFCSELQHKMFSFF